MRTTRVAWTTLGAATLFVVVASSTPAAPAPAQTGRVADKWEYAEIHYNSRTFREADEMPGGGGGGGGRGGRGGRGFPGGGGGPGGGGAAPDPAVPAAQPALPRQSIRWVTGDGEIVGSNWE